MFLVLLFGAGCMNNSPEAVYFTLTSIQDRGEADRPAAPMKDLVVGIGPVKFPDELDRPYIVTRLNGNQLDINEFHRWGGSLEKIFTQVMVDNMGSLLQTDHVKARPWERYFKPDIRIALDVHRFGGRLGEYGLLGVTWMVFTKGEERPVIVRKSTIKEDVGDPGYDALVGAQSRAIEALSREIVMAIGQISK